MEKRTELGMNRTGAQASPIDVGKLAKFAQDQPATQSDETIADLRAMALAESDGVGSVPMPTTLTGAAQTVVGKLTGGQPTLLVDKLGERLAFERTGTRLYEAALMKFEQLDPAAPMLADLRRIRDQEAKHFALLSSALERIGADPTAQTPGADVAGVMSAGLMQAITDPRTNVGQCLDALLVAELADNASWELLVKLTRQSGYDELAAQFEKAAREEAEHLAIVRQMLERTLLGEAAGGSAAAQTGQPLDPTLQ
ncbi:MAG TPA: ferritin-like domain-containing protein [Zeimonas sp.]|nr:ferritin-like domain-containing protein [Zeimonas sp.]